MNARITVTRLEQELANTFERAARVEEDQLKADLARYLCVLVSGYFESAVTAIALGFCHSKSHPAVARYVEGRLKTFSNVNTPRLLQFVGGFDPDWRGQVEDYVKDDRSAALDSVVNLRNHIAHGEFVGVSFIQIKEYYKSIKEVVQFLDELFDANLTV